MDAYLGAIVSIDVEKVVPKGIDNKLTLTKGSILDIILTNIVFSLPTEVKYYGYKYIFMEALLKWQNFEKNWKSFGGSRIRTSHCGVDILTQLQV